MNNNLTPRELEVLELKAQGWRTTEIGKRLFIDGKTVEHHWNQILQKLDAKHNTMLAVYKAYEQGLITPPGADMEQLKGKAQQVLRQLNITCDVLEDTIQILEGQNAGKTT